MDFIKAHKKYLLPALGGVLFALIGTIAGVFIPSEDFTPVEIPSSPNSDTQLITRDAVQENQDFYVYVTGAVKNPGVYKISSDARIFQALNLAGGFTSNADAENINLAEAVTDGAHIHIKVKSQAENKNEFQIPGTPANHTKTIINVTANADNSNLIDVNHAPEEVLIKLRGVGNTIAKRIIDYRNKHGAFKTVEDLLNVKGIGQAKLNKMRGQIVIK